MTYEAPKRIKVWANLDGTTQFEGGKLFPRCVEVEYTRLDLGARLQDTLGELVACVEDGCFCSEMRMASAVDNAREALKEFSQ